MDREDVKEIKAAGVKILNDDLSRLEFAIYLEAYTLGYENLQSVNMAENYILTKNFPKDIKDKEKVTSHLQR